MDLSPSAIILNLNFTRWHRGLPVYPDSRTRAGRGVYSHELPPSPPHGQRTNYPIIVPATLDGTARAWRSAYLPTPGVALPGKDIAFCLAVLLMGFTQMGKTHFHSVHGCPHTRSHSQTVSTPRNIDLRNHQTGVSQPRMPRKN